MTLPRRRISLLFLGDDTMTCQRISLLWSMVRVGGREGVFSRLCERRKRMFFYDLLRRLQCWCLFRTFLLEFGLFGVFFGLIIDLCLTFGGLKSISQMYLTVELVFQRLETSLLLNVLCLCVLVVVCCHLGRLTSFICSDIGRLIIESRILLIGAGFWGSLGKIIAFGLSHL